MEVADYLRHVESRLHEESDRVLHYLDSSTKKMLIVLVEKYLLEVHVDAILQKGFSQLMVNHRHEDLRRMYTLFTRVGALDKLKVQWNAHIKVWLNYIFAHMMQGGWSSNGKRHRKR
jgi:cullin-4